MSPRPPRRGGACIANEPFSPNPFEPLTATTPTSRAAGATTPTGSRAAEALRQIAIPLYKKQEEVMAATRP